MISEVAYLFLILMKHSSFTGYTYTYFFQISCESSWRYSSVLSTFFVYISSIILTRPELCQKWLFTTEWLATEFAFWSKSKVFEQVQTPFKLSHFVFEKSRYVHNATSKRIRRDLRKTELKPTWRVPNDKWHALIVH